MCKMPPSPPSPDVKGGTWTGTSSIYLWGALKSLNLDRASQSRRALLKCVTKLKEK